MGDIYGGHLVARYLKEVEKISTVFALSGGHIQRILDGFTEYEIRAIDVRHEQAAAMNTCKPSSKRPACPSNSSTTAGVYCPTITPIP